MPSTRSINLNIRAKPREIKMWQAAAKRADETLSEWVRMRLNLSAIVPPPTVQPVISGDQVELPFKQKTRRRAQ